MADLMIRSLLKNSAGSKSKRPFLSSHDFHDLQEQEKNRSDRSKRPLSMIAIKIDDSCSHEMFNK